MTSLKETAIEPRFSSRITPMDTTNPGKRSTLPSHNPCKLLSPYEIPALSGPTARDSRGVPNGRKGFRGKARGFPIPECDPKPGFQATCFASS